MRFRGHQRLAPSSATCATEELGRSFPVTDANLARLSGMKAALNELATRLDTYLNSIRNANGGGQDVSQSDALNFLKGTEVTPNQPPLTFTFTDPTDPNLGQVTATVTSAKLEVRSARTERTARSSGFRSAHRDRRR